MTSELFIFWALTVISIGTGVAVIATKSAIRSALALVVNFFVLAMFYFLLGSQFLGVVQIFVYLGAIMVLFLFCIMLLRVGHAEHLTETGGIKLAGAIALALIFLAIVYSQVLEPVTLAMTPPSAEAAHASVSTVEAVGSGLFTRWAFPFEATSVLLLVGIVGSVLLAKRRV